MNTENASSKKDYIIQVTMFSDFDMEVTLCIMAGSSTLSLLEINKAYWLWLVTKENSLVLIEEKEASIRFVANDEAKEVKFDKDGLFTVPYGLHIESESYAKFLSTLGFVEFPTTKVCINSD